MMPDRIHGHLLLACVAAATVVVGPVGAQTPWCARRYRQCQSPHHCTYTVSTFDRFGTIAGQVQSKVEAELREVEVQRERELREKDAAISRLQLETERELRKQAEAAADLKYERR